MLSAVSPLWLLWRIFARYIDKTVTRWNISTAGINHHKRITLGIFAFEQQGSVLYFKMQGFNMGRYVPPELEGLKSANQVSGKHALGARARKLKSEGILTVRFEMPYAVWCSHCPKPTIIGQGVRFNAEKKKVGNYHSTPIFSFRMKHAECGGVIEIRTDPRNTAYVVTEGGKARDTGEDKVREGEEGLEILSPEEREKRRQDAFAVLEGKKEDKAQEKEVGKRIRELYEAKERDWDDPYEASRRMRRTFRAERKVREKNADVAEKLKDRMGLDLDLLPENEDDAKRARMIEYGALEGLDDGAFKATSRPLFQLERAESPKESPKMVTKKKPALTRREKEAERRRTTLQQELRHNSRAARDPFLTFGASNTDSTIFRPILGIKRKHSTKDVEPASTSPLPPTTQETTIEGSLKHPQPLTLVAYGSDDSE